jgi:polynucleotide 5'-kinase involved in rRNA processing
MDTQGWITIARAVGDLLYLIAAVIALIIAVMGRRQS